MEQWSIGKVGEPKMTKDKFQILNECQIRKIKCQMRKFKGQKNLEGWNGLVGWISECCASRAACCGF